MSETKVLASVLHGAKDLKIEERALPAPGDGEVQVAVQATGLCGSDLHYHNHGRNGDIILREPLTLGHESAGIVTAVGPGVTNLQAGDRIALEVGQPCEECPLCAEGRYNICKGMSFRSSAKAWPHAQGTLQQRINHPAKWCYKLPDAVSLELGALLEPLGVAMHAHNRGNIPPNSATVLVLGAGAVGLLTAAISKSQGQKVIIADINAARVDFAKANGFADAGVVVPMRRPQEVREKLDFAKEVAEMVFKSQIDGKEVGEVDAAYECTGVESCMHVAIYSVKPGGKLLMVGMGTPIQTLPISAAALKEVDLIGVFRYANTYPKAIELVASKPPGLPALEKLITQRFNGLQNIQSAFDMAGRTQDDDGNLVIKVLVDTSS